MSDDILRKEQDTALNLKPNTTIQEILEAYPELAEDLPSAYPQFEPLRNPAMRAVMARVATLEHAASIAGVPVEKLLADIADMIRRRGGAVTLTEGEPANRAERVAALKRIIERLHAGGSLEEARRDFQKTVGSASPTEIAEMEQQLIRDGMPVEEIQRLCDLHVNVVRLGLDKRPATLDVPAGHPVHTYLAENREIARRANAWTGLCRRIENGEIVCAEDLTRAIEELRGVDIHYSRKEHQLFPALEAHGFTGPGRVMWGIHDEIRAEIKAMQRAVETGDRKTVAERGVELARKIAEMIFKEERILFPTALSLLSEEEWVRMRQGDDAIGYLVEAAAEWRPRSASAEGATSPGDGLIQLSTGSLTQEQLDRMLVTLPVEISFVDENDTVRFYSDHADRIFPRGPGAIGRKVQNCHPQSSVDKVEEILHAFKSGQRDSARFWINYRGRLILITYYAVRSREGRYLGCMEVTQDITEIKTLEGERRLAEWR